MRLDTTSAECAAWYHTKTWNIELCGNRNHVRKYVALCVKYDIAAEKANGETKSRVTKEGKNNDGQIKAARIVRSLFLRVETQIEACTPAGRPGGGCTLCLTLKACWKLRLFVFISFKLSKLVSVSKIDGILCDITEKRTPSPIISLNTFPFLSI